MEQHKIFNPKMFNPKTVNKAREYTFSVITEKATVQRCIFEKELEAGGKLVCMKNGCMSGVKPEGRVDNLLTFVKYVLIGDQLRRKDQQHDAIIIYTAAAEAYENGMLEHYLHNRASLKNTLDKIGFAVRDFAYELQGSGLGAKQLRDGRDGATMANLYMDLPMWLNFQTPEIHFIYNGMGRSFQRLEYHALAAVNYYKAKYIGGNSARTEEGLGDALIGNRRHRNSDIGPLLKSMPDLDEQVLISAAYKYSTAENVLERKGFAYDSVQRMLKEREDIVGSVSEAQKLLLERETAFLVKMARRVKRIRTKKEKVFEML
jgi:hypothetical protein